MHFVPEVDHDLSDQQTRTMRHRQWEDGAYLSADYVKARFVPSYDHKSWIFEWQREAHTGTTQHSKWIPCGVIHRLANRDIATCTSRRFSGVTISRDGWLILTQLLINSTVTTRNASRRHANVIKRNNNTQILDIKCSSKKRGHIKRAVSFKETDWQF